MEIITHLTDTWWEVTMECVKHWAFKKLSISIYSKMNLLWEEWPPSWHIFVFPSLPRGHLERSQPLGSISSTPPPSGAMQADLSSVPQVGPEWSKTLLYPLLSWLVWEMYAGRSWEDPTRQKSGNLVQVLYREMVALSSKLLWMGTWEQTKLGAGSAEPWDHQETKPGSGLECLWNPSYFLHASIT